METFLDLIAKNAKMNLSIVRSELKLEAESNYVDFVIKSIKNNNELTVFCCKCSSEYNKSVNCCIFCGINLSNFVSRANRYGDIPKRHPEELPSIKRGKIIDRNPNSH